MPVRRADGNKGTFGKALIIAGSAKIAGAAMLAAKSAFRIGAGMVKVVTAEGNKNAIQQFVPEAMLLTYTDAATKPEEERFMKALQEAEAWADCIMIGPGIGMEAEAEGLLRFVILKSRLPLVIDADGINLLARDPALQAAMSKKGDSPRTVILTPHLGEFARIYDASVAQVKKNMPDYARLLAKRLQCIVVCKDARTAVAEGNGTQGYLNTSGNSGMATAGSGDVLAGMITGLLAQGMKGMDAAIAGVYLHGCAGDLAAEQETEAGMMATDLIACIKKASLMIQGGLEKHNAEDGI